MSQTPVRAKPTGKERHFEPEELIVSKTDLKGRITYANEVFLRLSDYHEKEVLGQPHSLIRHPDMPRCVFKLLWDEIAAGHEIFAYVVNMSKNGDHYWVYAHITPSLDANGKIIGYHSNRRVADPKVLKDTIIPLYAELRQIEESTANRKDGMIAAEKALAQKLSDAGLAYDKFIQSL
ncbi:PAS domain S-box-containing protein [Thalassospira sp. MBR-102]|mgnify:FL=1|uniref:Chemotaxis protein n=3 Tax=Thalassospira TaxID=168934 RepID=A0ABR5Y834_9PROT|nr:MULTISPECIES: PAS domain-containing protein [Thalassospira]MBR9780335.1 PAS domain-containing protein [Rhodospirillales bacterium]AJD53769.1 chemotaxis sensory transducer [Thalassospira xiamenensis M-5 = DSM 17429]KEO59013.1 chemotaxis protein [Thalassospira permensis NBRC 106175]KZD06496.1 chemotaxis protein [Thalassospira xiamenensis]KZD10913.1 chemotaxis protein [Thalassospira xiamenensis]